MGLRTFLGETLGLVERDAMTEDLPSQVAWQAQITDFWANLSGASFSPTLIDKLWVVSRCIQLNAQQIACMPLRFYGTSEPAWVANPDPVWFPNGIGDAVFAIVDSMYRWGDAFLYVTSRYANGYPSAWTVLNAQSMNVDVSGGRRRYRLSERWLETENVVQISRDRRAALRGTSLIKSYASQGYALLAASDLGRIMMNEGAVPNAVLKSNRKLSAEQALALQEQWVNRVAVRRGAPAVLPPDIEFEQLAFSPADLLLLDAQKFDAQVLASAAGVPALFLNLPIEGGLNYQSPAMLGEHWWRFELRPMAVAISQAFNSVMLPKGSYVEFDARETLAPTFDELVVAVAKLVEDGIITLEEARIILRLPPEQGAEAIADLMTPPSAGATPAQQPSNVVGLRPTGTDRSVGGKPLNRDADGTLL